jgi:hypothetical protein
VASLASQPGDVILSRVNKNRSSKPVLTQMTDAVKELGIRGLFCGTVRGLMPTPMQSAGVDVASGVGVCPCHSHAPCAASGLAPDTCTDTRVVWYCLPPLSPPLQHTESAASARGHDRDDSAGDLRLGEAGVWSAGDRRPLRDACSWLVRAHTYRAAVRATRAIEACRAAHARCIGRAWCTLRCATHVHAC